MISIGNIHTAFKELLGGRFPGAKIYEDLTPVNFERPSFLVECGDISMDADGRDMINVTAAFKLTAFAAVDSYHNSQVSELSVLVMAMLELFAVGYLEVGDRALHVAGNKGSYGFDYAEVLVTLSYTDDRTGEEETYETMGAVHTQILNKED